MGQRLDFIQQANAAYLEDLYARVRQDPGSVPEDWALFFAGFELGGQGGGPSAEAPGPRGVDATGAPAGVPAPGAPVQPTRPGGPPESVGRPATGPGSPQ